MLSTEETGDAEMGRGQGCFPAGILSWHTSFPLPFVLVPGGLPAFAAGFGQSTERCGDALLSSASPDLLVKAPAAVILVLLIFSICFVCVFSFVL